MVRLSNVPAISADAYMQTSPHVGVWVGSNVMYRLDGGGKTTCPKTHETLLADECIRNYVDASSAS